MLEYKEGYYYKRTYKNTNHFTVFKVINAFNNGGFMFIHTLRCGKIREEYDCALKIKCSGSKTVELFDIELTALLL